MMRTSTDAAAKLTNPLAKGVALSEDLEHEERFFTPLRSVQNDSKPLRSVQNGRSSSSATERELLRGFLPNGQGADSGFANRANRP